MKKKSFLIRPEGKLNLLCAQRENTHAMCTLEAYAYIGRMCENYYIFRSALIHFFWKFIRTTKIKKIKNKTEQSLCMEWEMRETRYTIPYYVHIFVE